MLHLRVLGEFSVTVDGRPEPVPASRPARSLLAWLAVHPGVHPRSELAALLWPDVLDSSARTSLRSALVKVTRCVGAGHLVATREMVGLDAKSVDVDLARFSLAVAEERLTEAWDLGRGALLPGIDDDWVHEERPALSDRVAAVLRGLADAAEEDGDLAGAIAWTRELVDRDPLSEECARSLMIRLVRVGDRGAALTAFERLRGRLAAELSSAPSPKTRLLEGRIRDATDSAPARQPAVAAPPLPPIVAARGRKPFVGRAEDLGWLDEAWRRARGEGTVVAALGGHPGVGKTALAARFAASCHDAGATVLFGRCQAEPLGAYEAVGDALGQLTAGASAAERDRWAHLAGGALVQLVPALAERAPGATGEPAGAALRVQAAVGTLVAELAADRPVLLALDDVHWADAATLGLLARLAGAAREGPLLVLLTFRRAELGAQAALRDLLGDLRRDGLLMRRAIEGMDERDATALVAGMAGRTPSPEFVSSLLRHTDGNPFFMEEVLGGWRDAPLQQRDNAAIEAAIRTVELPAGVQRIIGRRLEQLPAESREALVQAAVLGPEFDVPVLAKLCGMGAEALLDVLDEPLRLRLLETAGDLPGRLAFHHALVREVLLHGAGAARLAEIHGRAARSLEAVYGERRAAEVAQQYLAAPVSDAGAAVGWARRAAGAALGADRFDDAAHWLSEGLAALGRAAAADAVLRAALLLELSVAQRGLGLREEAQASCREAMAAARDHGDAELLAHAALAFAGRRIDRFGSEEREEIAALEEALDAIGDGRPGLRARILGRLALSHYMSDPGRVDALAAAARASALEAPGDDEAASAALEAEHYSLWRPGHARRRVAVVSEALALAERRSAPLEVAELLNWRMDAHFELGDMTAAGVDIERSAELARRLRTPELELYSRTFDGVRAMLEARFDDAAGHVAAVTEMAGANPPDDLAQLLGIQHFTLADVAGALGELVEPLTALTAAYPLVPGWRLALACALVDAGDVAGAHRELASVIGADVPLPQPSLVWLGTMTLAARACRATGDAERTAIVRDALAPHADCVVFGGYGACWGPVALHLGTLEAALGDREAAVALFESAEAWAGRNGAPGWVAEARLEHGLATGDAGLVADAGDEALRLGMTRLAARAQPASASPA